MCSAEPLREFIRERLTAAAEEIFTQLEKTIVQYEEEIRRQRRLLELSWRPRSGSQRADLQRHVVSNRKDVLLGPLLSSQESLSEPEEPEPEPLHEEPEPESLDEDPEGVPIKEEPEDDYLGEDEEQLHLKQEVETFLVSPADEDGDDSSLEPSEEAVPSEPRPGDEDEELEGRSHDELSRDDDQEQEGRCRRSGRPPSGQGRFSCKMCSKSFSQKASLTKHLRLHTGGNPFTCLSCGRSFRKHFSLIVHTRIHTGEKPFPCLVCGKSFCQRGNLNVHMRTHTGEKPFPCLTCGKHFQRKSNLTAHARIHRKNAVTASASTSGTEREEEKLEME